MSSRCPELLLLALALLAGCERENRRFRELVGERVHLLRRDILARDEHCFVQCHLISLWLLTARRWSMHSRPGLAGGGRQGGGGDIHIEPARFKPAMIEGEEPS